MSLFGALIRTAVNVATLPVSVVTGAVCSVADAADNRLPGSRTIEKLREIKEEADT